MNICMFGASSSTLHEDYYKGAADLGKEMAKRGHTLVFGGGNEGLMGSCVKALDENGGYSIGIAPRFFDKPGILYENCSEFFFTDTMRQRKQMMEENSDAFIIVPGGIGTFEEFLELLTRTQRGRHNQPLAVFNIRNYYNNMVKMLKEASCEGFLKDTNLDLFSVFDNVSELLNYVENY